LWDRLLVNFNLGPVTALLVVVLGAFAGAVVLSMIALLFGGWGDL
jgi:hypothetical protein